MIVTQNIRRLSFYTLPSRPLPSQGVVIDGSVFLGVPPAEGGGAHYCISEPADVPCTISVRSIAARASRYLYIYIYIYIFIYIPSNQSH
eukprot:COSAG06_NODE_414_length_16033_cov_67.366717_1_plen_88_part_10